MLVLLSCSIETMFRSIHDITLRISVDWQVELRSPIVLRLRLLGVVCGSTFLSKHSASTTIAHLVANLTLSLDNLSVQSLQ